MSNAGFPRWFYMFSENSTVANWGMMEELGSGGHYKHYRESTMIRRANSLMLLVAKNQSTPAAVLESLASEDDPELLEQVAENPNTPAGVLEKLSMHPSTLVRTAVSCNPSLPLSLLQSLAKDESADVRYSLASNPHLPSELLNDLSDDENPYVQSRAHETLSRLHPAEVIELMITHRRQMYWKACYNS